MSDLIRREDVFKTLGITDKSTKYGGDHSGYNTLMLYEIKGAIDSIPTAEPKVGKWRHYEGMLTCSECGEGIYDDIMELLGDDVPHYCPNCGAKMERRADEGIIK